MADSDREMFAPGLGRPSTGVVVTGGASGIGLACAKALAAVGRPVALWDIDADGARAAAEEISKTWGVKAAGVQVDLVDPDAYAGAAGATRDGIGEVGGLVHSAGFTARGGIDGVTTEVWDTAMALHVRAIIGLVQVFRADLRAAEHAAIVAMSSINATIGAAGTPTYCAAKGAVLSLVHSMADELSHDGIRVNSLSPGVIATPLMLKETASIPDEILQKPILLGRFGRPEEIARVVRFLLSAEASFMTAGEVLVDGGMVHSLRF